MDSDNTSVCSGSSTCSTSNQKVECPCCKNELTVKYMFNHIRTKHAGYFHKMTHSIWLEEASKSKPLKVYWEESNDFDELEFKVLFACLSSNKTFQTEYKAQAHFKKNPKDLKEHNKQVSSMLKVHSATLKAQAKADTKKEKQVPKNAEYIKVLQLRETNDREYLDEWSKYIETQLSACSRLCEDTADILGSSVDKKYSGIKQYTVAELHTLYKTTKQQWATLPKTYQLLRDIQHSLHSILLLRHVGVFDSSYASHCPINGILSKGDYEYAAYFH